MSGRASAGNASWLAVVGVLGVLLDPARASADNPQLSRARSELDGLRFEEARASLDTALRSGVNGRAELLEIYRLTGQVRAVLGDASGAEASFRKLVALEPSVTLPAGTSPKIAGPFQAAQAWAKGRQPLAVRVDLPTSEPLLVVVTVDSDPLDMVAGARAIFWTQDGGELRADGHGKGTISIDVSGAQRVVVHVVDEWGNRLVEAGTLESPLMIVTGMGARPAAAGAAPSRPFYTRFYLWYAIAIGFGAGGTYFGLAAKDSQDELDQLNANSAMHDFSEAKEVEDRGQRQALFANISFAAAGAFAVVGTIFLVRDLMSAPTERAVDETSLRATPAILPDGAGLVITGGW